MSKISNLPTKLCKIINEELQPDEYIKWIAQPIPNFFIASVYSCGGFFFTYFGLPSVWGVLENVPSLKEGWQFQHILSIPFFSIVVFFISSSALIGIVMIFSPLWVYLDVKNTVYLVTNKRAIYIEGNSIKSYLSNELKRIYCKEGKYDIGDVIIAIERWQEPDGYEYSEEIGFMRIINPHKVAKILKQLANEG